MLRKSFFIGSNISTLSSQIVEILEFTNSEIIITWTRHACNHSCFWGFHSKNSANNATNTSKIDLCTIYTQCIKICVNWLFQPQIWDEKWEGQSQLGLKITKQRKTCTTINPFFMYYPTPMVLCYFCQQFHLSYLCADISGIGSNKKLKLGPLWSKRGSLPFHMSKQQIPLCRIQNRGISDNRNDNNQVRLRVKRRSWVGGGFIRSLQRKQVELAGQCSLNCASCMNLAIGCIKNTHTQKKTPAPPSDVGWL